MAPPSSPSARFSAPSSSSDVDEERDETLIEATVIVAASSAIVTGLAIRENYRFKSKIPRAPIVNSDRERDKYMNSILNGSRVHCIGQIRMSACILDAILKLYPQLIRLQGPSTPAEIQNNARFYPWFSDCIRALDGTHIRASFPLEHQARFRGRKGMTQNVLATVTFDLKFSYVLAGWEGYAHDSRVLNDALSRPSGLRVPKDKFYLADSGYALRSGFIPPYRGVRYHLNEFSKNHPKNEKELFNHRHSSLRNTVERAFGVLKKRFRVLDDAEPFWNFELQVKVVLVCCILHNHIRGVDPNDEVMQEVDQEFQNQSERASQPQTRREEREDNREWSNRRDAIAHAMWCHYVNGKGKEKESEVKKKQFRWTKPMERLMLQILADEVKQGNKPNNVFKTSSLNRVTNVILEKFCVECSLHHVENHLRTVKSYWNVVCTVQGKSGFGWDDNLKMITPSPKVYEAYTQAHPTHEKFLNKKIEMYDEMSLVLGKDCATGSFAKSFIDVDLEARSENEVLHVDGDVRSEVSSQPRQHRKRTRDKYDGDTSLALISEKLGAMADAITRLTGDRLNVQVLHDEIMAMDGFDEFFLGSPFDYLVQNEMLAKAFLAKRDNLRRAWLDNFANNLS